MDRSRFISRHGKPLARVEARPDAEDWKDDETLTIAEAAALFFPDGPLCEKSLRLAESRGQLGTVRIAGKLLTTAGAVRAMLRPPPSAPTDRPHDDDSA